MHNTDYRKYNVDAYDPAQFHDKHENLGTTSSGPDEHAICQLLEANKLEDALKTSLLSPPLGNAEQELKERCTILVSNVLHSFKQADIDNTVLKLSIEEGDILMKYIYKAMQLRSDSTQSLLIWHAHLISKFGHGSIVRVLADRQRL